MQSGGDRTRMGVMKDFDTLILGGMVFDGLGGEARRADVGLKGDRIAAVEDDLSAAEEGVRAGGARWWRRRG